MKPVCPIQGCGMKHSEKRHLERLRVANNPKCINGCDEPQHALNVGLCRPCYTEQMPYVKDAKYRKFGITYQQYKEMVFAQKGLCAICEQPETMVSRHKTVMSLAVDHNHETGKVRALLCARCNTVLGKFQENTELFENAINYLNYWKK